MDMGAFEVAPKNFEDEFFDVEAILKQILETHMVLKEYKEYVLQFNIHRPLLKKERRLVSNRLTDYCIQQNILLRRGDFPKIAEKVMAIFKKDPKTVWYKPPRAKGATPGGVLYTNYSFRLTKKKQQLKKLGKSTASYYR